MKRSPVLQTCLLSVVILAAILAPSKCFGQKPAPGPDNYVDLGDAEDEKFHDLRGWGEVNAVLPKALSRDTTSRYQRLRGLNSVKLFVTQVGTPYKLSFRSEAGLCDDSFEVYVNNTGPLYVYRNKESSPMKALHQLRIDASLINDTVVEVAFRNMAEDSCGRAAISYVALEPLAETFPAQQSSTKPARLSLQRALETVELFADREKIALASYSLTEAKLVAGEGGERYWHLRWENNTKAEDCLEFTVSVDGLVTYRFTR